MSIDPLLHLALQGFDFDDPIDVFGPLQVSKGGRWYQRSALPALDQLFEQQEFLSDPEARQQVIYAMDKLAMHDAALLIVALTPHLMRRLYHELQLPPLLIPGQLVAWRRGREAAASYPRRPV